MAATPEKISNVGHACFRAADNLQRQVSALQSARVTREDVVLGRLANSGSEWRLDLGSLRAQLREAEALLTKTPDATFQREGVTDSLEGAVDYLRGALETAKPYERKNS